MTLLTSQWKSDKTILASILLARMAQRAELAGLPLATGQAAIISEKGPDNWEVRCRKLHMGSLLSLFFAEGPVRNFADAKAADHARYARFFHHMLDHGVALPPSGYELWTLGTEHGPDEVGAVLEAAGSFEG